MTSPWLYTVLIVLFGLERLAELVVSKRNAAWAFARGGVESGRGHFPPMVLLHTGLLVGALAEVWLADRPFLPWLGWPMLVLVVGSQALRWWCITTLGRQWNTRRDRRTRAAAGGPRPLPLLLPPQLRRRRGRGSRPAAGAHRVGHRAGLHRRERLPAPGPARRGEPRAVGGGLGSPRGMTDLLVVGGGPVGLATALHAVRRGLSVTVWEPRPGTIDKACGEGLMPGGLAALAGLGIDPPGEPLTGIDYRAGSRSARAAFGSGPGRGVRRTTLHEALRTAVLDSGVRIVPRKLTRIEQQPGGVRVDGEPAVGHVVAADGLHSTTRRLLGLGRGAPVRRYGQRVHVRMAPWTSYVEVHWGPHAEAYVTPVADDLVGIAVLTSVRAPFHSHLTAFPSLVQRLTGRPLTAVQGAGPLWQRTSRRVAGRVLLVGDAAGYVDALTGEGISLGLAQAEAAVGAVVDGDLPRYERDWVAITRSYRLLTTGLLAAAQLPLLRRAVVPAASALPAVFSGVVNTLAGPPVTAGSLR